MTGVVSGQRDQRIVPYDPSWPQRAQDLIARLRCALDNAAHRFEHIGSTSVPGLAARPIPDIQISVHDIHDDAAFGPALERLGYAHFRFPELDVDDYFVFVPADGSNTEHIQVCESGSHQELRHLAVRDYLCAHASERDAYEDVKRRAAEQAQGERGVYSRSKDAFVHALEQRAIEWQSRNG